MARSKDLKRGYTVNPLGIRTPVKPAEGQPMPGFNRTKPIAYPAPARLHKKRVNATVAIASAIAMAALA